MRGAHAKPPERIHLPGIGFIAAALTAWTIPSGAVVALECGSDLVSYSQPDPGYTEPAALGPSP